MNLLSGLEKFGLDITVGEDIFATEEETETEQMLVKEVIQSDPAEEEFLLEKSVQCKVCDRKFKTKMVKNSRLRRLEPDKDLRPRFLHIDTLKYDVSSCPYCGYTAMNRYFDHIAPVQIKLIREEISSKFQPTMFESEKVISYDKAIERYKLALLNTVVKRGKSSEKAYTCLKIAWLLREKISTMPEATEAEKQEKKRCKEEEEKFYQQAYDGFLMAIAKEPFPICGMGQNILDYMLAYMSFHFGKYENASKFLGEVLTSHSSTRKMKDKALDLKDEIVAELKKKQD